MDTRWAILLGCVLLAGCVGHETDFQVAQEERDAMLLNKRMKEGCQFVRDQDAYRECLLNTYYSQYPKGYRTAELSDGEALAIVSDAKASASCTQNQRSVSQVAPLPPAGPQIVPYATTEVTTIDSSYTQDYVAPQQATVVKTQEIVAQVPVQQPLPPPVVQPVVMPQPVVTPAPQQDPSWWDNYQQTRTTPVVTQPVCPCPDPNDPCPQCFEK